MPNSVSLVTKLAILLAVLLIVVSMPSIRIASSAVQRADSWTCHEEPPESGGYGEAVTGTCGHIYTAQCYNASSPSLFWRYDPQADHWAEMNVAGLDPGTFRNGTALAWDHGDTIYALAGARYSDPNRRVFLSYDIPGDSWTTLETTPGPQGAGDAMTWSGYDGYLYAIMGSNSHGTVFARYDPDAGSWALRQPPPQDTDDGCSLVWTGDAYLYAFQGELIEDQPSRIFWRYDMESDTWLQMADVPDVGGVSDGGSLLWIGHCQPWQSDYIYALGGGSYAEESGDGFYRYTISTDTWEELANILYPIGYYVGSRLGFAEESIYCWQGSSRSYPGGGTKFCSYYIGEYNLALDASYDTDTLNLNFTLGTPEESFWANYLVLTSPSIQVIPLWSVPLPVIEPPMDFPISFPFPPSVGSVGIWTGLFTEGGPQAVELVWVDTGVPGR